MAPYFVQMRDFERRLIRGALVESDGDTDQAATMLGVSNHYIRARAKWLGGVIGEEPKHEPPGPIGKAWNSTHIKPRRSQGESEPHGEIEPTDVEVDEVETA